MAERKKKVEFDPTLDQGGRSFTLRDLLDGNVLTRGAVRRQGRFILLVVLLAFLSIANRNHAEQTVIHLNHLQSDVRELRARSISISSDLVRYSRQSEVARLVQRYDLGLEENLEPPKKLLDRED